MYKVEVNVVFDKRPKTKGKVLLLPVTDIYRSPFQPRKEFNEPELNSLARSIAQNGLLVPISVRVVDDGYQLIAGERRLKACKSLGMTEIPAIVEDFDDSAAAVLSLIENIHRQGLNCFEEAEGIRMLLVSTGYSQTKVCSLLDMPQPTVANKLRLLRLPQSVQKRVLEYNLGERIARALIRLEQEQLQLSACDAIHKGTMKASTAERYIESLLLEQKPQQRTRAIFREYRFLFSTVDKAVEEIKKTGIDVFTKKTEENDYICYTIRVPKVKKQQEQAAV